MTDHIPDDRKEHLSKLSREELMADLADCLSAGDRQEAMCLAEELARRLGVAEAKLGESESVVASLAQQNIEIEGTSNMRYDEICGLDDEVKDLKAALKAATEWRPIETAPKGSSPLLGWAKIGRERIIYYSKNEKCFFDAFECCADSNATHWLPIPPPPKGKGEGE